jgi:hypothetical protein
MSSAVRDLTIGELESVSGGSLYVKINNPQPVAGTEHCMAVTDGVGYCWCDGDFCW